MAQPNLHFRADFCGAQRAGGQSHCDPRMKLVQMLIKILLCCLLCGCQAKGGQYTVLFVGAKSDPAFEDVKEGTDFIASKQPLAVFGLGELGRDEWGLLTSIYTNGESRTFKKGGVVAWAPAGVDFKEVSGKADVELVAYLVSVRANAKLEPSSMVLKKKWKIAKGSFKLDL